MVNNHHALWHIPCTPVPPALPCRAIRVVVLDDEGSELPPNQPGVLAVDIAYSPLSLVRRLLAARDPGHREAAITGPATRWNCEPDGRDQLRWPRRRYHHLVRLPHRAFRCRERPDRTSGRGRGGGDRQARPGATEIVKAFVVLASRGGALRDWPKNCANIVASGTFGPCLSARDRVHRLNCPKTPSGKLQRFILRNNETALAEQKTSSDLTRGARAHYLQN